MIHIEMSPSPDGSLNNSSECLAEHDDSDLTEESVSSPESDKIIKAQINISSSPSQLTDPSSHHHHKPIMSLRDYLRTLDRHKSIDNCFLSPSSAQFERMYFIDEIKKLTNHLFKITAQAESDTATKIRHENEASDHRIHDINIQNNLNTTSTTTSLVDSASTCEVDENNNKINDTEEERRHPFSDIFKKFSSLADSGSQVSVDSLTNAHWPVSTKRTKFRINQMSSRDVPIFKTEKPAKLKKQNAIDACDTKLFDEEINHKSIFHETASTNNRIVNLLESFEHKNQQLFQSHFRHKTTLFDRMLPKSFDCGQIGDEERSINTIRSLFRLHATTGRNVKHLQEQIEAKTKIVAVENVMK
jgi:hypothetical protein